MPVYTVALENKPIAVFNAASIREANKLVHEEHGLADDWIVLESEGKAIWDGIQHFDVREATPIEYNRWQASRAKAREAGEDVDDIGMMHLLYLIPVSDPTDDYLEDQS
jgi:hypothetical protein